jgi:hypothetical protein
MRHGEDESMTRDRAIAGGLALVALLALCSLASLSCSRGEPVDLTRLRVFFTTDAIGYLEPCG